MEPVEGHPWVFGPEAAFFCRTCRHMKYPVKFPPECSASQCHLGPQDSSTFKRVTAFWGTISITEQTLFNFNFYLCAGQVVAIISKDTGNGQ